MKTNVLLPFNFEIAIKFKDYIHAMLVHYVLFETVNRHSDCIEWDDKVFVRLSKTVIKDRFPSRKPDSVKAAANDLVSSRILYLEKFKNADYFAVNLENDDLKWTYQNQKDFLTLTQQIRKPGKIENYQQFLYPRLDYSNFYGMIQAIITDRFMFLLSEDDIVGVTKKIVHKNIFLHLSKSDLLKMFPFFLAYETITKKMIPKSGHILSPETSIYGLNIERLFNQGLYNEDKKFKKLMYKVAEIKRQKQIKIHSIKPLIKEDEKNNLEKIEPTLEKIEPTSGENRADFGENRANISCTPYNVINNLRVRAFFKRNKNCLKLNRRTMFQQAENSTADTSRKNFLTKSIARKKNKEFLEILKTEKNTKFKNLEKIENKENFTNVKNTNSARPGKLSNHVFDFFSSGFGMAWGDPASPDFPEQFDYLRAVYRHLDMSGIDTSLQLSENASASDKAIHKISSLKVLSCQLLSRHNAILQLAILDGIYKAIKLKKEKGEESLIKPVYVLQTLVNALQGNGGIISGRYVYPLRWRELKDLMQTVEDEFIDLSNIRAYDVSDIIAKFYDLGDNEAFVISPCLEPQDSENFTNVKIISDDIDRLETILATHIELQAIQDIAEYA